MLLLPFVTHLPRTSKATKRMAAVPTSVFPTYIAEGRFTIDDDTHQNSSTYILTLLCLSTTSSDLEVQC